MIQNYDSSQNDFNLKLAVFQGNIYIFDDFYANNVHLLITTARVCGNAPKDLFGEKVIFEIP